MDITKLTHLPHLLTAKPSGLKPLPKDARDFNVGIFGWLEYKPKHKTHVIDTLSVQNQYPLNICTWSSATVQKELDERVKLEQRSIVAYGQQQGFISGNGFANLRSPQKVLKEWGIAEGKVISEGDRNNWYKYSRALINGVVTTNANQHKTSSFWSVGSRGDILKLLDDNRTVTVGMNWYTGFNQSGGFREPWLITKNVGYYAGGHAVLIKGYNLNYQGVAVYICQNSYGPDWGDGGDFYVEMGYLEKQIAKWGAFTNLDIEVDTGKFLRDYDGKAVKGQNSPKVFHIQNGTKKWYPNELAYIVWNETAKMEFDIVDDAVLDKIPEGDSMDITKSPHWNVLKTLEKPYYYQQVLEAIKNH